MPFVNVKLVKDQCNKKQKNEIIEKITELIVKVMNRDKSTTIIVIDDIDSSSWAIGGKTIDSYSQGVSFINIKVSKGTTNLEEMSVMIKEIKSFMSKLLTNYEEANYVIIDELNPSGWGFGDISMTERAKLEE